MTPSLRHLDLTYFLDVFTQYHPALEQIDPLEPNMHTEQVLYPTRRLAVANRIFRAVMQYPRRVVNNLDVSFVGEMSLVYCQARHLLNLPALTRLYLSSELFEDFLCLAMKQFDPRFAHLDSDQVDYRWRNTGNVNASMQRAMTPALTPYEHSLANLPNLLWKSYADYGFVLLFHQSVEATQQLLKLRFNLDIQPEEVLAVYKSGVWVYQPSGCHSLLFGLGDDETAPPPESFSNRVLPVLRERKLRLLM